MFDVTSFVKVYAEASAGGVSLALLVLGLVAFAKQLGVKDKGLTITSMVLGLVFGCPYMYSQVAAEFAKGMTAGEAVGSVLSIAVFGLGLGLIASGVYKVADGLVAKGATQFAAKIKG